tara:strand:- start:1993 stop:2754 length:762 start_codon:yes stop_codon:yes gene_type:complete
MQGRLYPNDLKKFNLFPKKWQQEFNQIKKMDFNYLELLYDRKESDINPLVNKIINYKSVLKHSKNKTYSINLDFFTRKNFFKNIQNSKKLIKKIINNSNNLKVKLIVIPCIEKNQMTKKELIRFINILKKLIVKKKILISLELNNFNEKVLRLLNKKIGICFDTGNLAVHSENYLKKFSKNINKINHIHIKDKKIKNKKFINCRLGTGIVKFKTFFSILKVKKYKRAITLETNVGNNPILEAKKNLNFLKKYL